MNAVDDIKIMSDQEIIGSYIMYGVTGAMNMKIRNGIQLSADEIARKERLSAALKNLPVFQGVVYRKVRLYDESWVENFAAWHKVGCIVRYDEFVSASTSFEFVENHNVAPTQETSDMDEFEVILKIQSKQGKTYIHLFPDADDDEKEVLFTCNSQFKVLSVSKDGRNIELEEI